MLNFVICDDEQYMINKLSLLFEKSFVKNDFNAKVVLKTTNYDEILSFINSNTVNVVVLDIDFKDSHLNGLDVAKEIRKVNKDCYIIFITSHFEYVMEAYEYKTFAYLIKSSISLESVSDTLIRLFDDINCSNNKFLKIDHKGTFVDLNDVQFIEKDGMKLIYHTSNNYYETYSSFSKIEELLPEHFVRCHKSFIVNVNNVAYISLSNSTIKLKNDSICYIGPKYKNDFLEVINYDAAFK